MVSEVSVKEDDDGIRLDRWFKRHYPAVTHGMLEKFIRKGFVRIDGKKAKASDRVEATQSVRVPDEFAALKPQGKPKASSRQKLSLDDAEFMRSLVLHKDKDMLVLNKPAGLAVQGGTNITRSVDGMLDALCFDAPDRPKLVHRIDKDTSGILVLARHAQAANRLTKAFARKDLQKVYWALVVGVPNIREGHIDLPLAKQAKGKDSRMEKIDVDEEDGQRALTDYRVIDTVGNKLSWVELLPITGRTHQLRVHMAAIGHPIIGDGKYGGSGAFVDGLAIPKQLHLHARRIIIPGAKEKGLDLTAPLPKHMQESWKLLGLDRNDSGLSLADR